LLHKSAAFFVVLDGSIPLPGGAFGLLRATTRRPWVIANKSDIGFCWETANLERIKQASASYPLQVSAKSGTGCELLLRCVLEQFGLANPSDLPLAFFTERQAFLASEISISGSDPKQILISLLGEALAESNDKAL